MEAAFTIIQEVMAAQFQGLHQLSSTSVFPAYRGRAVFNTRTWSTSGTDCERFGVATVDERSTCQKRKQEKGSSAHNAIVVRRRVEGESCETDF